jgi:hypothetical protein
MLPAVRALADRFIYDSATVKYIATSAPGDALERLTPGSGWSVRQLLAHLALTQQRYADNTRQWLHDPSQLPPSADPTERNVHIAAENEATPLSDIVATLDASTRALVAACGSIDDAQISVPYRSTPFLEVLTGWSRHHGAHAVDLVSALPEFETDPMVLNWALFFDYSARPEWAAWQANLIREVREHFQLQGDDR